MEIDIERVARIARLELTTQEKENLKKQLNDILKAFSKIDEVDVSKIDPSFHPIKIKNVMRDDNPEKHEWDPFSNTKNREGKYFKGPKIVGD